MTLINRNISWDMGNGSSLIGYTPKISYDELSEYIGEPEYGDDDKVPYQWEFMFKDGKYASIYPYRYEPDINRRIKYHIGGHNDGSDLIVNRVKRLIYDCRAGKNWTVIWSGFK
jgi:hypothetical protein